MDSPLGRNLANAYLCFYEKNDFEFKPVFYRTYVHEIFVLIKSTDRLKKFCNYFNSYYPNMSFPLDKEKKC